MKSPFRELQRLSRSSRRQTARNRRLFAATLTLQKMLLAASAPPKKKRAKAVARTRTATRKPPIATKSLRSKRPAPGTFVDGKFDNKLPYKLYTPQGSPRRRLPLIVMLHGCTQSAAGFARDTGMNELADEFGFLVLYPEQTSRANLGRCWNWHRPGNQNRGRGEPAAIAALTRQIAMTSKANPARIYIAGISAGGAAAAIIGAAYPDLFAAVGVHSGLARGNITTLKAALLAMRTGKGAAGNRDRSVRPVPTISFHGDQDGIVHPSNADGFLGHLLGSGVDALVTSAVRGRSSGGRDFTRTEHRYRGGKVLLEQWTVHGSGHAWSGGSRAGSHTDPAGPDASREMIRFFLERRRPLPA